MESPPVIRIRGAREHNLAGIDLDLPRDRLVVFTGVSGSGKSSLAFDTIHAEGRRQYVESLSVHARQLLEQLRKPDVDLIEGLPPTLAIEQRTAAAGPRSTVATITEIHDHLRLLLARTGVAHCLRCATPVIRRTPDQVAARAGSLPEGTRLMVMAPMPASAGEDPREVLRRVRRAGFVRVRIDGVIHDAKEPPLPPAGTSVRIDAVVDRIVVRADAHGRIAEAVELAVRTSEGAVILSRDTGGDRWEDEAFSDRFVCPRCSLRPSPGKPDGAPGAPAVEGGDDLADDPDVDPDEDPDDEGDDGSDEEDEERAPGLRTVRRATPAAEAAGTGPAAVGGRKVKSAKGKPARVAVAKVAAAKVAAKSAGKTRGRRAVGTVEPSPEPALAHASGSSIRTPGIGGARPEPSKSATGSALPPQSTAPEAAALPEDVTPALFSFNSPAGMCATCGGMGTVADFDETLVVPDLLRSLAGGAVHPWANAPRKDAALYAEALAGFAADFRIDRDLPLGKWPGADRALLLHGGTRKGKTFEGVIPALRRMRAESAVRAGRARLTDYLTERTCPACAGVRLRPEAHSVRLPLPAGVTRPAPAVVPARAADAPALPGVGIAELAAMSIDESAGYFGALAFEGERAAVAGPVLVELRRRLGFLRGVGTGYLTLDRRGDTLSGGESQRIRLAGALGGSLAGVCYVLDEPTAGLHPEDNRRLLAALRGLADRGNTVLVVEHDEDVIRAADLVVDIGPGAGPEGGRLVAVGTPAAIESHPDSVTGAYLSGRRRVRVPEGRRPVRAERVLRVAGATEHNLRNIDVTVPLGLLTCVTGVSGSGKSTLVADVLLAGLRRRLEGSRRPVGKCRDILGSGQIGRVIEVDQAPLGRSPRSTPATYTGVFDDIRRVFAKTREARLRGFAANRFSFNVPGGRCEACQGQGVRRIEMLFLPDVSTPCDVCRGWRYDRATLEIRWRGRNIGEVLDMRVDEALPLFDAFPEIRGVLAALRDTGAGHLTLGRRSSELSGGEAQRVKLAAELGRPAGGHTLYVLDEPTTGLHAADIARLTGVLQRLVDMGNTVLVIEHDLDMAAAADRVIDLGPGPGAEGGRVVAEGTPEEVAACAESVTGRWLKQKLARMGETA